MNREDITHLASLARLELTEAELTTLESELSSIVEYVSAVKDIASSGEDERPLPGARFNVFRADEVTNLPDQYTAELLAEMPKTAGRHMVVKKILHVEE